LKSLFELFHYSCHFKCASATETKDRKHKGKKVGSAVKNSWSNQGIRITTKTCPARHWHGLWWCM